MIAKNIESVALEDLERLVQNGVSEDRTLDYKEVLAGASDEDRRELLSDVSALANSIGGDIVFGVVESRDGNGKATGIPNAIVGIRGINRDAEQLRLEHLIRDGIQPRLPDVSFRWVPVGTDDAHVLVLRVARSWIGPHMVTFKNLSRFYARGASGKIQLDVLQIRNAFLSSAAYSEKAAQFRIERLTPIFGGRTALPLTGKALTCVHVVPHQSIDKREIINVRTFAGEFGYLAPLYSSAVSWTYNLDGLLVYSPTPERESWGYTQLFRDGMIETVDSGLLINMGRRSTIPSRSLAEALFGFVERVGAVLRHFRIEPPVSVFVTLSGVAGAVLGISSNLSFYQGVSARPFDRDVLLLPEVVVFDFGLPPHALLRSTLDVLWQSSGISHCMDFDKDGNWKPT